MKAIPRLSWLAVVAAMTTMCAVALALRAGHRSVARRGASSVGPRRLDGGVVIEDITIDVPARPGRRGLRRPAGRSPGAAGRRPAILFLHWLGQIHNDRTEYLAEAVTLAEPGRGVRPPAGHVPVGGSPGRDDRRTSARSSEQEAAYQRGARHPRRDPGGRPGPDRSGRPRLRRDVRRPGRRLRHAGSPPWCWRRRTRCSATGSRSTGSTSTARSAREYLALFQGLDPVDHTARLGDHVLFQWAGKDIYIGEKVRDQVRGQQPQTPRPRSTRTPTTCSTTQRMAERDAFLADQLGFG